MTNAVTQGERWHHYEEYDLWVSDMGAVQRQGKVLSMHLVNSDLRVTTTWKGNPRSFSVKRLVADVFVEKPFVGNTGLIELINGNPRDCRAKNLVWKRREQKNRGAAGEPGVSFNKGTKSWKTYVVVNRTVSYIGYYTEKDRAIVARDKAYEMIANGIPIKQIREELKEPVVRAPIRESTTPKVVRRTNGMKGSWREWDVAKEIFGK